jgi:hypothetical protein
VFKVAVLLSISMKPKEDWKASLLSRNRDMNRCTGTTFIIAAKRENETKV